MRTGVSLLLVAALLAPAYALMVLPKPVEAGPTPVIEIGQNVVQNTANAISNIANAATNLSLATKELFWDTIFNMAAKAFLRAMVTSIVNWINSGFQGAPSFVTDFRGFLLGIADGVIGDFIYNDPSLNFLCSPFELDIKIALAVQYRESRQGNYEPQCTLSGVVDNVEGFFEGAFDQGGWPGMIEMVHNPVNNPTGAFLSAQGEAYARVINAQGQELTKVELGNGFLNFEICDVAEFRAGTRENCIIGTPGSVIANSINKALGAGQDELIAADEINEIFNALFSQLIQQAVGGVFGLLGLGGSNTGYTDTRFGRDNDLNYLEAIIEEEASTTIDTSLFEDILPINESLEREQDYQEFLNEAITRVDEAERDYSAAVDRLDGQGCSIDFEFPDEIEKFRTEAETTLPFSEAREEALQLLSDQFEEATDTETQQLILERYRQLEDRFGLRTGLNNSEYQQRIEADLVTEIRNLNQAITRAEDNCDDD